MDLYLPPLAGKRNGGCTPNQVYVFHGNWPKRQNQALPALTMQNAPAILPCGLGRGIEQTLRRVLNLLVTTRIYSAGDDPATWAACRCNQLPNNENYWPTKAIIVGQKEKIDPVVSEESLRHLSIVAHAAVSRRPSHSVLNSTSFHLVSFLRRRREVRWLSVPLSFQMASPPPPRTPAPCLCFCLRRGARRRSGASCCSYSCSA